MAAFLDFQACTNAAWDRKPLSAAAHQALRLRLEQAGLESWIMDYLCRLGKLEMERPSPGGDPRHFDEVRAYREAVARLSLATVAGLALDVKNVDEGLRATYCQGEVAALFRMAMQCQIIDDVLDYARDRSGGLPSFLTAVASLPQAIALTEDAARSYGARPRGSPNGGVFPLEAALGILTALTKLVVGMARAGLICRQGLGSRRTGAAPARCRQRSDQRMRAERR